MLAERIHMILTLAIMIFLGALFGQGAQKLRLPALLGMMVAGWILGPQMLNWVHSSVMDISQVIRSFAMYLIIIRAGLNLELDKIRPVRRQAILMCFLPASLEIVGVSLLGPVILGLTRIESVLVGGAVAAVAPAVVVPRMIELQEENLGESKGISQIMLACAAFEGVVAITIFQFAISLEQGAKITPMEIMTVPASMIIGGLAGIISVYVITWMLAVFKFDNEMRALLAMAFIFLIAGLEQAVKDVVPFSSLVGVIVFCIGWKVKNPVGAQRLAYTANKMWKGVEVMLFTVVGAMIDFHYIIDVGFLGIVLIAGGLVFRSAGVGISLLGSDLNAKERMFCGVSSFGKATVQAAIGGIPLAMGLACGETVMAMSVLAIVLMAPVGDGLIQATKYRWLKKD